MNPDRNSWPSVKIRHRFTAASYSMAWYVLFHPPDLTSRQWRQYNKRFTSSVIFQTAAIQLSSHTSYQGVCRATGSPTYNRSPCQYIYRILSIIPTTNGFVICIPTYSSSHPRKRWYLLWSACVDYVHSNTWHQRLHSRHKYHDMTQPIYRIPIAEWFKYLVWSFISAEI